MRVIKIGLFLFILSLNLMAQTDKKPLTHDVYDSWKSLKNHKISKDGNIVVFNIVPQEGDANLFIYNNESGKKEKIERAVYSKISPLSDYVVFKIKPYFNAVRKAKLKKVKKNKMPKDTLGIWIKSTNEIIKVPSLKSFKTPMDDSNWFAYLYKKEVKKDTTKNKKGEKNAKNGKNDKKKDKKKKKAKLKGDELVIFNPIKNIKHTYSNVVDYQISKNGRTIAFVKESGDTTAIKNLCIFNTKSEELKTLSKGEKDEYKKVTLSKDGLQLAYVFTNDTSKTKVYSLYYKPVKTDAPYKLVDTLTKEIYKDWTVQPHSNLYFSLNGKKLYFSVAPKPVAKPKDTLLPEEKYHVDIWNWKDKYLQPMQLKNASKEKKRTYLSVFHVDSKKIVQLADTVLKGARPQNFGDAKYAVAWTNEPYAKLTSWDQGYYDVYLINTETGKRRKLMNKISSSLDVSISQKYVAYYQPKDSMWHVIDLKKGTDHIATKDLNVNFYNELNDVPQEARPYGIAGWTEDDKYLLIYDIYDIWKIDPSGKKSPVNLTSGLGRKNNITFRYKKLNEKVKYIDESKLLLTAFNKKNKQGGLYTVNINAKSEPVKLVMENAAYQEKAIIKAKNADKLLWRKGDFKNYPELYYGDLNLDNAKKLSETNPQQKEYRWGTVQLVDWITGDGEKMQGKLYLPENLDKTKKHPMLVYFYERSSDGLNGHHVPQPNWSIINMSYCVSNGYIVFVPDITYHKEGFPGECAYSAIVTGTLSMLQKYPFIDKDNMALQGQSWGGYQIAYLVTRTNLYKCAMAGAPVSNMTSAYGGMRWGSGMSRMFQYEKTQSRIGGTLWNKTIEYIENSPIFFAPKIETPLLIMHNDHDGAVPWYQGIELFTCMRRLNKPVWMLVYNKEEHNLRKRANRKDLSKRTMQFFDYYLKGEPIPEWMNKGIPAHKKGEINGY